MACEDVKPHSWEKVDVADAFGPAVMFQWWTCRRCRSFARSAKNEDLTDVDVLTGGLSVDCDEQLVEEVHEH